jgi:hypothetical protein
VKGSISPQIPPWEELVVKEPAPHARHDGPWKILPRQSAGIDIELIKAGYSWLPALDEARSEDERAEWIDVWEEMLRCLLRTLGEPQNDEEIGETPYDWDRWVFDHIADLIMQLRPDERPEDFWFPILNIGVPGHYWVESFLVSWFAEVPQLTPNNRNIFIREWQAMIEFAFSSPMWDYWSFESGKHWFRARELWCDLMGFHWINHGLWTEERRDVVKQMRGFYGRWADEHLAMPWCAVKFITFLRQPAAEDTRLDGLIWLEEAAKHVGDRFWRERYIEDNLAYLLDLCWRSHESELRRNQLSFGAFKDLLKTLADRQNALAMELQDRMSR